MMNKNYLSTLAAHLTESSPSFKKYQLTATEGAFYARGKYYCCMHYLFEPADDKTNEMACTSREDSDQPGHPPSLFRVVAVRSIGSKRPKLSSCGLQRL